jgi:hypothetical protein
MFSTSLRALLVLSISLLTIACGEQRNTSSEAFCTTLAAINKGEHIDPKATQLGGQAQTMALLKSVAPEMLHDDIERVRLAFANWDKAVSGDHPMLDTFAEITEPALVGAQGRITDYVAEHCGIDLGGEQWVEAPRPSAQSICEAWPRIGTPMTFNNFPNLPDIAGSNYFANDFFISKWASFFGLDTLKGAFVVEPGGWVEFKGQYPATRYMAYHPNDMDLNNLPTLRDRDLEPDAGSVNPFRKQAAADSKNYYTARLVFDQPPTDASQRQPNTRYVGVKKDGATENKFVLNLMRMYHIDAGNGEGSGGVPLPAVSIYNADGELDRHFPECDLFAPENPRLRTEMVFPSFPVADHRARKVPKWIISSNFDAPSDTLANADVQYATTHYSERFGDIFLIRGKYLSAPDTRGNEPVSTPGKDIRLYNLCTYNFWNGGANHCMLENDLSVDDSGYYTLLVARKSDIPANLAAEQATWIDWGPFLDGQMTYRYVFRENPYVQAIASALVGRDYDTQYASYVPRALPCTREIFERDGWRGCFQHNGVAAADYE